MIKYLFMDIDGSLTDGKIYMGNTGELMKAFSVKDGYAVKHLLRNAGIEPIVITARESDILSNRCKELGITRIYQGRGDKLSVLKEVVGRDNIDQCAYFGDDILDLQCMIPIKEGGGIIGCPVDAVEEIRTLADHICISEAGNGAFREFVEWLLKPVTDIKSTKEKVLKAIEHLGALDRSKLKLGKYKVDEGFYYLVEVYMTSPIESCRLVSHKKYINIHWIIQGQEAIEMIDRARLKTIERYEQKEDIMFWKKQDTMIRNVLQKDSYIVFYPEVAYMSNIFVDSPVEVKKIVGKVLIG